VLGVAELRDVDVDVVLAEAAITLESRIPPYPALRLGAPYPYGAVVWLKLVVVIVSSVAVAAGLIAVPVKVEVVRGEYAVSPMVEDVAEAFQLSVDPPEMFEDDGDDAS